MSVEKRTLATQIVLLGLLLAIKNGSSTCVPSRKRNTNVFAYVQIVCRKLNSVQACFEKLFDEQKEISLKLKQLFWKGVCKDPEKLNITELECIQDEMGRGFKECIPKDSTTHPLASNDEHFACKLFNLTNACLVKKIESCTKDMAIIFVNLLSELHLHVCQKMPKDKLQPKCGRLPVSVPVVLQCALNISCFENISLGTQLSIYQLICNYTDRYFQCMDSKIHQSTHMADFTTRILFSSSRFQRAYEHFCLKLTVLQNQFECFMRAFGQNCVGIDEILEVVQKQEASLSPAELENYACQIEVKKMSCFTKSNNCSSELTVIMKDYLGGILPDICKKRFDIWPSYEKTLVPSRPSMATLSWTDWRNSNDNGSMVALCSRSQQKVKSGNYYGYLKNTVCTPEYSKYIDCVKGSIGNSSHAADVKIKTIKQLGKWKPAVNYICKYAKEFNESSRECAGKLRPCKRNFEDEIDNPLNEKSKVCWAALSEDFCNFKNFGSCKLNLAIVYAHYADMYLNPKCKVIASEYSFFPVFTPDIHCYPKVNIFQEKGTLIDRYMAVCRKVNFNIVSVCLASININMEFDRKKYLGHAAASQKLCKRLLALPVSGKCVNARDFDICHKNVFREGLDINNITFKHKRCLTDQLVNCSEDLQSAFVDFFAVYLSKNNGCMGVTHVRATETAFVLTGTLLVFYRIL